MQQANPKDFENKYVYLKYVGHIAFLTGKTREALGLDKGDDISRLISKLDKKYNGLKEIFVPPSGVFNSRTGIIIRRAGQPTFSVIDEKEKIENGDILTLW